MRTTHLSVQGVSIARRVGAADTDEALIKWLWNWWLADRQAIIAARCAIHDVVFHGSDGCQYVIHRKLCERGPRGLSTATGGNSDPGNCQFFGP